MSREGNSNLSAYFSLNLMEIMSYGEVRAGRGFVWEGDL